MVRSIKSELFAGFLTYINTVSKCNVGVYVPSVRCKQNNDSVTEYLHRPGLAHPLRPVRRFAYV